ncbi:MAG: N-acetyltransferase [Alphaproteobacteria bacterium CG11_big_fil_rev_8_21_14_0_20_39_49]|nr:MAG: N-acetyltransferase [Alphaproteobacteria bacterium CG11_big_fil_rev_8_21_14_0_20_39_49]
MGVERVFNSFPIININEELILRQISYNDAKEYYEYMQDNDVIRYVPEECIPRNMARVKEEIDYNIDLFRYRRSVYWVIARKDNDMLIGSCGFNYWNRDHRRGEISYDLNKKYWGNGIMSQAVKAVLGFAFSQMDLHRVEATVTPTNKASINVLRKAGFKKEGVLREQKLLHGNFEDAIIMSLLQREYLKF